MFSSLINPILDLLFPPACVQCGRDGSWVCAACLGRIPPVDFRHPIPSVDRLISLGRYVEPVLERSIQRLKYHGGRALAEPLADHLATLVPEYLRSGAVIPVPLHPKRMQKRGFNQSERLAVPLAQALRLPLMMCVRRTRCTVPQVDLNERERSRNVRGAFSLADNLEQLPKRGIIVDDVFTTGATISAVARVLRTAGMQHITAVTVAKS